MMSPVSSKKWLVSRSSIRRDRLLPVKSLQPRNRLSVRCLDLLGAIAGLALLSPLLLVLAVVVKATSPGPVLFRSLRIGLGGRPFVLLKYRSMIPAAPALGPAVTSANDPRVTTFGRLLRQLKLDELPQLINVLRGDMSLVGPRPEDPTYVARYSREQLAILEVKPGITSPASMRYRDEAAQLTGDDWEATYVSEVMPAKLAIDLEYVGERTAWSDLRLILMTTLSLRPRTER
jgi:lipopolysaccharide/colanic/teichoic acid biosynthesis glycosyltransferase